MKSITRQNSDAFFVENLLHPCDIRFCDGSLLRSERRLSSICFRRLIKEALLSWKLEAWQNFDAFVTLSSRLGRLEGDESCGANSCLGTGRLDELLRRACASSRRIRARAGLRSEFSTPGGFVGVCSDLLKLWAIVIDDPAVLLLLERTSCGCSLSTLKHSSALSPVGVAVVLLSSLMDQNPVVLSSPIEE